MDYIKRFTTREGVRMSLAVTTDTVETARVRHDLLASRNSCSRTCHDGRSIIGW